MGTWCSGITSDESSNWAEGRRFDPGRVHFSRVDSNEKTGRELHGYRLGRAQRHCPPLRPQDAHGDQALIECLNREGLSLIERAERALILQDKTILYGFSRIILDRKTV